MNSMANLETGVAALSFWLENFIKKVILGMQLHFLFWKVEKSSVTWEAAPPFKTF